MKKQDHPVIARVVAAAKAMTPPLSEGGLCTKAGLPRNLIAQARIDGTGIGADSLALLCPILGKTVKWALGQEAKKGDTLAMLSFEQIEADANNPRKEFDWTALLELSNSIVEHGILEPLLVREIKPGAPKFGYRIVFGERRWRAVEKAIHAGNWQAEEKNIPCIIRSMTEEQALIVALVENLQRENMQPLDEAEAFAKLQKFDKKRYSTDVIASMVSRTPRYVQQRLALLKLDAGDQQALRSGKLDVTKARDKVTRSETPRDAIDDEVDGYVARIVDADGELRPEALNSIQIMAEGADAKAMVKIPLATAILLRQAFLPTNPNKLRGKNRDELCRAVDEFMTACRTAVIQSSKQSDIERFAR